MGAAALIALAALLCACGPRARIAHVSVARRDGRVVALVSLENSGGDGEVSVTVRLTDRRTGAVFVKEEGVPLQAGQPASAVVDVNAPPGDYEAAAEAAYPP